MKVKDVMSSPVEMIAPDAMCCSEDTDMEEAARIMEVKKIHRLLILDDDDEVSGILSIADLAIKMRDEHLLCEVSEKVCEPLPVR